MQAPNHSSLWERNDIQYPRLIAEILAAGALNDATRALICESMDIEPPELDQLLDRAETDWTRIKETFFSANRPPKTLKCPHCQYNGKKETNNGQGFRYLSNQTTWREIYSLKKGILLIEGRSEIYGEDTETNERIECRSCLSEFPIPPGIQTDFC
jgi:hypothetical protein